MKILRKKILPLIASLVVLCMPMASFARTANDAGSSIPYSGSYGYGSNMGYYGTHLSDTDIAALAYNAGSHTVRLSLPDWLLTGYGKNARTETFQKYAAVGLHDLTVFVGEPNDPKINGTTGPDNRETKVFPGASERAKTFKGLYEPVWLDAGKTKINPANTFASYLYTAVMIYGDNVKFWEIVNEPDFTYSPSGWQDASSPTSWWHVNPSPDDLGNLKAPVQYYVRELRVAYDVIKTLRPDEYVATGGIGYASFLDSVMRNTDNPVDGSVTPQYPQKGGAYFDVLSFHSYPMYGLRHWDNASGGFVYTRHSDAAVDVFLSAKNEFAAVLAKYGYDGSRYPAKQWMSTETDLPQTEAGSDWGSAEAARNYIVKTHILAQANGVRQLYKYGLGENSTDNSSFNTMGIYGNLTQPKTTVANAPKTDEWYAMRTLSDTLFGKTYDAAKTAELALPSAVRGAAFRDLSGGYTYVLWAKTATDKSENASAVYAFPFPFSGMRREWNYSQGGQSVVAGRTVTLGGSPSYFTSMQPAQGKTNRIVTMAQKLNVRSTAGGRVIMQVPSGATGVGIGQASKNGLLWKNVAFDSGKTGWVASAYLRVLGS